MDGTTRERRAVCRRFSLHDVSPPYQHTVQYYPKLIPVLARGKLSPHRCQTADVPVSGTKLIPRRDPKVLTFTRFAARGTSSPSARTAARERRGDFGILFLGDCSGMVRLIRVLAAETMFPHPRPFYPSYGDQKKERKDKKRTWI